MAFVDSLPANMQGQVNSALASARSGNYGPAFGTEFNQGGLVNWVTGEDPVAHNEAFYAWQRDEASAEKAREDQWRTRYWEADREDTQFQRKLEDYLSAGFSPLAALEGSGSYSGNYSASSAQGHSPNGSPRNQGGPGNFLTAIVGALAMIASKGMSTSAMAAKTATETAAKAEVAEKAAAAKMAAAETTAQAKVDSARIFKFGDDIKAVGQAPAASSAAKSQVAEKVEETAQQYFDRTGKAPSWGFTAKEAKEAENIIGELPKEWIYRRTKKK